MAQRGRPKRNYAQEQIEAWQTIERLRAEVDSLEFEPDFEAMMQDTGMPLGHHKFVKSQASSAAPAKLPRRRVRAVRL